MQVMQGWVGADDATLEGRWYAVSTRHQHERMVADTLAKKGFETFLPLYSAAHRWKDRTKILSLPLYPSYVFLRGGFDRRLQLLTTPGLVGVVGFAGRPGIIPEAEMEAIRRVIAGRLRVEPFPFLNCGERVRVKSGPLEGIEGILIRKRTLCRLVLSVELLGRSVAVEVDSFLVEPVRLVEMMPVTSQPGGMVHASF
jgi:transcription antitermination factor NusG